MFYYQTPFALLKITEALPPKYCWCGLYLSIFNVLEMQTKKFLVSTY